MVWQTEALGGPVLAWELKQATRRKLGRWVQIAYCAWLVFQAVTLFGAVLSASWELPNEPHARLVLYRAISAQQIEVLDRYLVLLLAYQLALVIASVPAFIAMLYPHDGYVQVFERDGVYVFRR